MAAPGTARSGTSTPSVAQGEGFGDRLASLVAERSSQLVLGLDPDPARLWPRALELARELGRGIGGADAATLAAGAVRVHCVLALDAVGDQCVAVKFQVACFERL